MRRHWFRIGLVCSCLLLAKSGIVHAQAPATRTPEQLTQENEALRHEVESLRARLAELQHVSADTAPTAAPPAQAPIVSDNPISVLPPLCEHDDDCVPECLDRDHYGERTRQPTDPPDLTLWNFFSAGWDEDWVKRSSEDRAPDLALLHVQTNFMEREIRFDSFYQSNVHNKKQDNIYFFDGLIAYGWNRRFQTNVQAFDETITGRGKNPDLSGPQGGFLARFQLISKPDSSYAFNLRINTPDPSIGTHETAISYGLAGFEDLTGYGLYRVGLYGSCQFESLEGPGAAGAPHNDVQYVVTLAKTLTRPDTPLLGNFTVYVENFGQTSLDGSNSGHTVAGIMPGVRFNLGKLPCIKFGSDNWILFGVDLPVVGPTPWDATYRLTYIKNF